MWSDGTECPVRARRTRIRLQSAQGAPICVLGVAKMRHKCRAKMPCRGGHFSLSHVQMPSEGKQAAHGMGVSADVGPISVAVCEVYPGTCGYSKPLLLSFTEFTAHTTPHLPAYLSFQ